MDFLEKIIAGKATLADQEEALKDPYCAYLFALDVKEADIEKCQEVACKDPLSAYEFAKFIEGADIEKCQKAACRDPGRAYLFTCDVPGADMMQIKELYPEISDKIDEIIMERVLI